MRISILTSICVFFCLTGCSQDDHHNFNSPGKIPIDAKRWYQLNNTAKGLDELFNNKQYEKPNVGYGMMLGNYDAYYPLLDGEQMTIDSIMMFDWEGTNEDHPMTIYAITDDWKKIPIAVFTGSRYNAWNGPDPKRPDVYALEKPATNIRYLVINSWGVFPGEIEFYGTYHAPKPMTQPVKHPVPLKNYFGVNAFEWDFEEPNLPMQPDAARVRAIKNFTSVRHYLDWDKIEGEEGVYSFNPASSGGWNYDTIYQWCKAQNIEVLACLKTVPAWMQESYPTDQRDNENVPMRYGKDPNLPQSYIEQARAGFQYAARYGSNKNIDPHLIVLAQGNQLRIGMGVIKYIECDNERDKWWKGRKGYQTGREYAANLSAFYDGDKNKMGNGVGVKNADPSVMVVMAGLASPDPDYVRGMIDWCKEHRGYKKDGAVDLPWDIINYHYYCSDADYVPNKKMTSGVAPELTNAGTVANNFLLMAHQFANDMPVWITEAGYDLNQESPLKAPKINGESELETQADWILRTSLLYSRAGIQKVFYYELIDDNPKINTQFATSGLINSDRTNRPAADFLSQTNKLFGDYTYKATMSNDPIVDKYALNSSIMYMLVVPSQKGKTINYTLDVGRADTAFIYQPAPGSEKMGMTRKKTVNGKVEVQVTERPIFITTFECYRFMSSKNKQ